MENRDDVTIVTDVTDDDADDQKLRERYRSCLGAKLIEIEFYNGSIEFFFDNGVAIRYSDSVARLTFRDEQLFGALYEERIMTIKGDL